jgi:hypothetical protein
VSKEIKDMDFSMYSTHCEPQLMAAQTMWMPVHKMWSMKHYASSTSRTDYQKDGEYFDRF